MNYIIDTNIVKPILKKDSKVLSRLYKVILSGKEVLIDGTVYYEVRRGLLYLKAKRKLEEFEEFCERYEILLLNDLKIFNKASEIYVSLKRKGKLNGDIDILIAATALINNLIVVSNDEDFLEIDGLNVENWLR